MIVKLLRFIKSIFTKSDSCGSCSIPAVGSKGDSNTVEVVESVESVEVDEEIYGNKKVKVVLKQASNFTPDQTYKLVKAFAIMESVFNSQVFGEWCTNSKFTTTKDSGEQVFRKLLMADQGNGDEVDYEAEFYIEIDNSWKPLTKVVGWTNPGTKWQWVNQKFFNNFTEVELAGHLAHEYCHKIGYAHKSASDHKSVPYSVGYKVSELGKRVI